MQYLEHRFLYKKGWKSAFYPLKVRLVGDILGQIIVLLIGCTCTDCAFGERPNKEEGERILFLKWDREGTAEEVVGM
jgi:hypothetical protein